MAETIARAVEQIKKTVFLAGLDESATKQSVILRLLSLFGWDPFDPSQVVPEYTVGTRVSILRSCRVQPTPCS